MDRTSAGLRLGRLTVSVSDSVSERVTPAERLRRYAELAVRVGANVQPGQDVVVTCLVEHVDVAREVAREAYKAGADHVIVLYNDLHLRRAAIELGPESEIGWSAPYLLDWIKRWSTENPALISLTGIPHRRSSGTSTRHSSAAPIPATSGRRSSRTSRGDM